MADEGAVEWWARKTRRVGRYLRPRIDPADLEWAARTLSPAEARLFESIHPADRRHGLDVARTLEAGGHDERQLLVAALLHDAGKGPSTGLVTRVIWAIGQRYGRWAWRVARAVPPLRRGLDRMRDHAAISASLATAAGSDPEVVRLIRNHTRHDTTGASAILRVADESH